ncbi:response regulator transcription factor [Spirillospora sp. NPDC052242]
MLRVLIVDDHPVVREGLRGMLAAERDIEVAGEAASGEEAVALAPRLDPDVILMDLRMPSGDGVSAIRRLPGRGILVLTTYDDPGEIGRAIEAGAMGCLLKDASRAELAAAVRDVAAGRRAPRPARPGREVPPPVLSAREAEVLGLVAEGLTNAEIGARLHIGEATVKTHLLRAFAKLGVSDRTAAVVAALGRGAIRAP